MFRFMKFPKWKSEKAEEACGSGFVIYLINGKYIAIAMLKTRNSKLLKFILLLLSIYFMPLCISVAESRAFFIGLKIVGKFKTKLFI